MNLRWTSLVFASIIISASAMYFDLAQHREKCIIEEIPEDTLVTGFFLLEYWDESKQHDSQSLGLTVTVKDTNYEVVLMKRFGRFGKFTFTSHASGQHFLCVKLNLTGFSAFANERVKVHLNIQMGEHSMDPNDAEATDTVKGTVTTLENRMNYLIEQIQYIIKQQNFQRDREETFRQMSEETNGNVLWWAIVQTSILLACGFWQMKSLKHFLIEKKLV